MVNDILRAMPSVNELLENTQLTKYLQNLDRSYLVEVIREEQESLRQEIIESKTSLLTDLSGEFQHGGTQQLRTVLTDIIIDRTEKMLSMKVDPSLHRVINCSGTVLHTNLGRAPLSSDIMSDTVETVTGYSNLEFDLEEGKRGSRYSHLEELLTTLTGAESALAVNNNAAAVLLALKALASEREVIVSRGEQVEIGGSFRIPEVMKQSGAQLVEVGTTNKTHLQDYEQAITEQTGLILKVHTSNYRIVGFTDSVSRQELVEMAHAHGLYVMEDLGSGLLLDLNQYGLTDEPTIKEVIEAGVDLVTFSGDKLLGGPQAGIIAGKKELIDMLKRDQLTRALRMGKLSIKALEETLRLYLEPETAVKKVPVLNMLTQTESSIKGKAHTLYQSIKKTLPADKFSVTLEEDVSQVGGGAMPGKELSTWTVVIYETNSIENTNSTGDKNRNDGIETVRDLWSVLRDQKPPIITRIQKERLSLDPRTISTEELEIIRDKINKIFSEE